MAQFELDIDLNGDAEHVRDVFHGVAQLLALAKEDWVIGNRQGQASGMEAGHGGCGR